MTDDESQCLAVFRSIRTQGVPCDCTPRRRCYRQVAGAVMTQLSVLVGELRIALEACSGDLGGADKRRLAVRRARELAEIVINHVESKGELYGSADSGGAIAAGSVLRGLSPS